MAGAKGLEGLRSNGTDCGGPGYIHPRSDKYRDNYDKIKWNKCDGDCGEKCCSMTGEECCMNGMCD